MKLTLNPVEAPANRWFVVNENIVVVGSTLRDLMGVTQVEVNRGELIASYEDFLAKIHN